MKKILSLLALVLALGATPLASAGTFAGEKFVSSDPTVGAQFPEIAYFNGVIHVVFVGFPPSTPGVGHVYYSRSTAATGTFSTPVDLSAGISPTVDRAHVTAGPSGVVVAWDSDGSTGAVYTRRSTDGGLNFGPHQVLHGAEGDARYSRITGLMTDSGGRVHASFYTNADTNGASGMLHHRLSCDGGATWSTDQAITNQTLDGDVDNEQPRVHEAGGAYYLVYRSSRYGNPQGGWPPYSIILQHGTFSSCGSGMSWTYPGRRVAGGMPFTNASSYRPEIYADGAGWVHYAWWDNTTGANVHYRRSAGTGTMAAPAQISNFGVNHLEPGGVTNSGGYQQPPTIVSNGTNAFMGYARNTTSTAGLEHGVVLLRESTDTGASWGAEQTIASSGAGATPRFAIDNANTNNVGIVWTDLGGGTARVKYRLYTLGALGGGPSLSIAPDPVAFGDRQVGVAGTINVTVTNSGSAGTISSVGITDALASDYQVTSNNCGAIGAGASCTVGITVTAQALGSRPASLVITSDASDSPNSFNITANGIPSAVLNNNIAAVVTGYYETILGRAPDAGGKAFWIGEAGRVAGLGASINEAFYAMSINFFTSAEYAARNRNDTEYVTDLYNTFFVRPPDGAGLAFWTGYLTQGVDRTALLINFLFSPEFNAFMSSLVGTPSVRAEVDMTMDFFRGILGRLPDNGGFNFWLAQLRTAQCQGASQVTAKAAELAQTFLDSGEYAARDTARAPADRNRMFVGDLYNAFLRRGAEPTGYNFWVNQLNIGASTRAAVRNAFVASGEFQARVTAVIAAGCSP